ncbi:MAG: SRPBCC domain-containing protein [Microthrixaceae bacterium]|nr:SRPBCC domain-containing protein [Microthrixaceae bacterium]
MSETDDTPRSIELEVEVVGTPEEVWEAIATGPGITSWYVPHTVEEREGGAASASFGPGPEMQVPGRVAVWEPPRRIVFDGGEDAGGLVFEWRVEAHDDGTCTVGLVNSGFGSGEGWDDQYDGMVEGWRLFLSNLQLHMEHFGGLTATPVLPMAMWAGPRTAAWATLATELGIPEEPAVGERIRTSGDAPSGRHGRGLRVVAGDAAARRTRARNCVRRRRRRRRRGRRVGLVVPVRRRGHGRCDRDRAGMAGVAECPGRRSGELTGFDRRSADRFIGSRWLQRHGSRRRSRYGWPPFDAALLRGRSSALPDTVPERRLLRCDTGGCSSRSSPIHMSASRGRSCVRWSTPPPGSRRRWARCGSSRSDPM